jgi:phage terminase small subunit
VLALAPRFPRGDLVPKHGSPKAPTGLGPAGRGLWRAITADYELREDERQALAAACRTLDELRRVEDAMRAADVVVAGSKGQPRPNPLLAEARAHRLALRQLLISVGLDEPDAHADRAHARSAAGRRMARLRHGTRGAA